MAPHVIVIPVSDQTRGPRMDFLTMMEEFQDVAVVGFGDEAEGRKDHRIWRTTNRKDLLPSLVNKALSIVRHAGRGRLYSESEAMVEIHQDVLEAAMYEANTLILGPTGAGKELLAELIHKLGDRAGKPFHAVNCAAIPENLLESELFGHEKGAFTGAVNKREGILKEANGGTVFLDEIGDMPIGVQAKLLRFLAKGEVRPVGSNRTYTVDVRIIAATHQDLLERAGEGKFREDLYYRLQELEIELPPLQDRPEDLPGLTDHYVFRFGKRFKKVIKGMAKSGRTAIKSNPWKGNIRELVNACRRAVIKCPEGEEISNNHLPQPFTIKELEKVLKECGGNVTKAAQKLDMSRHALSRKLRKAK